MRGGDWGGGGPAAGAGGQEHPQPWISSPWGGGLGGDMGDTGPLWEGLCAGSTHCRSFPTGG